MKQNKEKIIYKIIIKRKKVEFASIGFGAYCVHPLDMLFVAFAGFHPDVVQAWTFGVPVIGFPVGSLMQSMPVSVATWL